MFELKSSAFTPYGPIPARYATTAIPGGQNQSIPYSWTGVPDGTESYALVLVDRAAVARNWVHWLVTDLPADVLAVAEGASGTSKLPNGARELDNTFGAPGYGGPQPPAGTGEHPYEATVFALDIATLDVPDASSLEEFYTALDGHVIAQSTYTGRFARP